MLLITVIVLVFSCLAVINCSPQTIKIGQLVDVTWSNEGKNTEFTLTSTQVLNGWIGIGFGRGMNNMETIICKNTPNLKTVEHYYNGWFNSNPLSDPNVGLSNVSVNLEGRNLTCKFSRANRNSAKNYRQISETGSSVANFVAAYGDVTSSGLIIKHKWHAKAKEMIRFSVDLSARPALSLPSWMKEEPSRIAKSIADKQVQKSQTEVALPSVAAPSGQSNEILSNYLKYMCPNLYSKRPSELKQGLTSVASYFTPSLVSKLTSFLTTSNIKTIHTIISNPDYLKHFQSYNPDTKQGGLAAFTNFLSPELMSIVLPLLTKDNINMIKPLLTPENIALVQNFLNPNTINSFSSILAKPQNVINIKAGLNNLAHIVRSPDYIPNFQSYLTPESISMFHNFVTRPEYMDMFMTPMYRVNWMNALQQWNVEYKFPVVRSEEEKRVRYYMELNNVQDFVTAMGAHNIETLQSMLGARMFGQLYASPCFIHFANYCLRNRYVD